MTPARLYTFKDVLAMVPCSERTLRAVIAQCGFVAGRGRKKHYYTEIQKNRILKELTCSSSSHPESEGNYILYKPNHMM